MVDIFGNLRPMPEIFPDYPAPIVLMVAGERELRLARWCLPSSQKALVDAAAKRADRLGSEGKDVDLKALLNSEPTTRAGLVLFSERAVGTAAPPRRH